MDQDTQVHDGILWESLTTAQKEEVLLAFEESENPYNLIDRKKAIKS